MANLNKETVSAPARTRVMVVDDHPLFRQGVIQLVARQPDLICCGEAGTVAAVLGTVTHLKPDVIVLDLRLGHEDGLELIKALTAQFPGLHILVLSNCEEGLYAERALRAGARGYLMKDEATEEVLTAIRSVLKGELYVSRKLNVLLMRKLLTAKPHTSGLGVECLTDRELQVFQMLGAGLGTRQIAEELHLSIKTVETHRENIKQKLDLANAAELVCAATDWVEGKPFPTAAAPRSL